jgi:hypothetical protein
VPSQCIQHDHTLPEVWVGRPHADIQREDWRLARRIAQRYELCLWNLFAKLGWVPFAPADAFAYNVHVGLDVGGRHNNRAMACLGYGYAAPSKGLLFRPEEIPIDVQKAEPIPTNCLTQGLLSLFEQVHAELTATGVKPDFERTLFFRDGRLLGDGEDWNELDALNGFFPGYRHGRVGVRGVGGAQDRRGNVGWTESSRPTTPAVGLPADLTPLASFQTDWGLFTRTFHRPKAITRGMSLRSTGMGASSRKKGGRGFPFGLRKRRRNVF